MTKKTVFVGVSGGVDSAVSAALLLENGYNVVGVFIKTWHPEYFPCNEEEERHDAMRVAAHLNIPFLTFDFEKEYKKEVGDYMISEYKAGRTPNPDVMCNKYIKFEAFLKKAISMGADFVATGHYAKSAFLSLPGEPTSAFKKHSSLHSGGENTFLNSDAAKQDILEKKKFLLLKSKDDTKDQSYFLWTLRQEQLKRILFPVGNLKKSEVRKLAQKFNLPVAQKKDSQGICFLGAIDLKEFLKHYIKVKTGKVKNSKGETIGYHDGVVFYTLGERHGFTITKKKPNDRAHYVVSKNFKKNILFVSQDKNVQPNAVTNIRTIEGTNWITITPEVNKNYTAQTRYHGEFLSCKILKLNKSKAQIMFSKPVLVASGQSCVIYDKDVCIGGGIIK